MTPDPAPRFWDHRWNPPPGTAPPGTAPRGTVVVLPGRGEHPGVYERLGRRLAFDGYRVVAADEAGQGPRPLPGSLNDAGPSPRVPLGADSGYLTGGVL
ncbi:alpha/beta hydrolase [Streptomyces sp. PT12]|uniref:serine aminopeptidase domain-containing protein n=1 Tax=Streptomyces sp. PT12 TaxID=1510197 RepID=UPI000DE45E86|nr:alpha/beta hydrolase [Streptomyces sp. PT12]RBM07352.1 hypothetical protein DEH69_25245 [Streptomyces sp. PT12]